MTDIEDNRILKIARILGMTDDKDSDDIEVYRNGGSGTLTFYPQGTEIEDKREQIEELDFVESLTVPSQPSDYKTLHIRLE